MKEFRQNLTDDGTLERIQPPGLHVVVGVSNQQVLYELKKNLIFFVMASSQFLWRGQIVLLTSGHCQ